MEVEGKTIEKPVHDHITYVICKILKNSEEIKKLFEGM